VGIVALCALGATTPAEADWERTTLAGPRTMASVASLTIDAAGNTYAVWNHPARQRRRSTWEAAFRPLAGSWRATGPLRGIDGPHWLTLPRRAPLLVGTRISRRGKDAGPRVLRATPVGGTVRFTDLRDGPLRSAVALNGGSASNQRGDVAAVIADEKGVVRLRFARAGRDLGPPMTLGSGAIETGFNTGNETAVAINEERRAVIAWIRESDGEVLAREGKLGRRFGPLHAVGKIADPASPADLFVALGPRRQTAGWASTDELGTGELIPVGSELVLHGQGGTFGPPIELGDDGSECIGLAFTSLGEGLVVWTGADGAVRVARMGGRRLEAIQRLPGGPADDVQLATGPRGLALIAWEDHNPYCSVRHPHRRFGHPQRILTRPRGRTVTLGDVMFNPITGRPSASLTINAANGPSGEVIVAEG
jgi:hypothetical protein